MPSIRGQRHWVWPGLEFGPAWLEPLLPLRETLPALPPGLGVHHGGGGASPRFGYATPPPPQAVEHPNTILEPNLDSNAIPTLSLLLTPHLTLIKTEYWDRAGGGGNISYNW